MVVRMFPAMREKRHVSHIITDRKYSVEYSVPLENDYNQMAASQKLAIFIKPKCV